MPKTRESPSKFFRAGALIIGCALAVALFYFGAQPFAVNLFVSPYDKFAHFGLFFMLASLFSLALAGRRPLMVVALVTALGVLDEWRQGYLPGRSMNGADALTDFAAVVCAVGLLSLRRRRSEDR